MHNLLKRVCRENEQQTTLEVHDLFFCTFFEDEITKREMGRTL